MKTFIRLAVLAMLSFGLNNLHAQSPAAQSGDPVIARGNGFVIKQSELDEAVVAAKAAMAQIGQSISPDQLATFKKQMVHRLVQIQLLSQKATASDKAAGKSLADMQFTNLLASSGSPEVLAVLAKAFGMTADELRTKMMREQTANVTLLRELGVTVTADEARQYYKEHLADYVHPETVHVSHILLMTMDPATHAPLPADKVNAKRRQIENILRRAKAGEDFAALAKQYSDDPGSRDKGGEYTFPRGQMVPEFEAAAFGLANTGDISDVVTTTYGFHIIKLLGRNPALNVDYAGAADRIKNYLSQQKSAKLAPAYLDNLEKTGVVEIIDAGATVEKAQ
jgi:parvulin-like peptidyl-prolyl isomerase